MSKITDKIKKHIQGIARTNDGKEVCDPKPRLLRTGIKRKPTQEERFMTMLNKHRQQMHEDQGYADETDFHDEEDFDFLTPYEKQAVVFDAVPEVPEKLVHESVAFSGTLSPEGPTEPLTDDSQPDEG